MTLSDEQNTNNNNNNKKIKIAAIRIKNSSNKGTVASIMGFLMMGNGRVWFCKST